MVSSKMNQALRVRVGAEGLRYPAGHPNRRGGRYKRYGTPGGRFLAELGDSPEKYQEKHEELARRAQDYIVDQLKSGLKRPTTSSGRLERVTADPDNIVAATQSWGVGVAKFLDNSTAKYWRTVDEGSANVWSHPFKGMVFYVNRKKAWGSEVSHGKYRSWATGGFMPASKGRTTEKMNPTSFHRAEELIAERGRPPRWMGTLYITKEIAAEDYYDKGFRQMGGTQAELRILTNAYDAIFYGYAR